MRPCLTKREKFYICQHVSGIERLKKAMVPDVLKREKEFIC